MSIKPNVLLVLTGESYRSGAQCTRTRGTGDYVKRQLLASLSHAHLIDFLKKKNYSVDIAINSYMLNEVDDVNLVNFYKKQANVVFSVLHPKAFPTERLFLNQMYDSIQPYIEGYDYIIVLRIDYYLKKYFFEIFDLSPEKIQFTHIDSAMNLQHNVIHNINHCLIVFPKQFYHVIREKLVYNKTHEIYRDLRVSGLLKENFLIMIPSLHVCSTDLGWNPLYIQVGRDYNSTYNVNNIYQSTILHYYDYELDKFKYDPSKTILHWKPLLLTDSLNENLAKLHVERFEEL